LCYEKAFESYHEDMPQKSMSFTLLKKCNVDSFANKKKKCQLKQDEYQCCHKYEGLGEGVSNSASLEKLMRVLCVFFI